MATGLKNLKIYQLAKKLEKSIYLVTDYFPIEEKFRKISQMRGSTSSVTDNISESYGRYTYKAKINCLYTARGEVEEIRNQIDSIKGRYIDDKLADWLIDKYTELIKGINGFIKFLKNKDKNK
ncbi:MAG: four helix bundle protein [Promethearchaeota archaeon]